MKQNSIFKKISPLNPNRLVITAAVDVLKAGGVLAFPTSGLYGLGADAMNPEAVEKIFRAKQRDVGKPILVLVKDALDLENIAAHVPNSASRMAAAIWPGSLTIILEARPELPEVLTGGTGKIGVRVPKHPVASALVGAFNGPLTGTSANLSGRGGCYQAADMDAGLVRHLDLVLDAGPLKGGAGSTIVDATTDPPSVLREGAIPSERLFSIL